LGGRTGAHREDSPTGTYASAVFNNSMYVVGTYTDLGNKLSENVDLSF